MICPTCGTEAPENLNGLPPSDDIYVNCPTVRGVLEKDAVGEEHIVTITFKF